ncbi:MAG TPA: glycosyltransferase family 9 protein [Casimicrobiaceae bacterium]|nr:glycosyltransferase family 9 protein [Casimicrobiaceae bacterium]
MTPPKSVLVVSLRYFGDLLLTTPLIRAIARGFEGAAVDVLATEGVGAMLEGNPDVRNIVTVSPRPSLAEHAALVRRLWRRYDLAVIAETGDRPHLYGAFAASLRAGLLPANVLGRWWKAPLLARSVTFAPNERRIDAYRRLAEAMALPFVPQTVAPTAGHAPAEFRARLGLDTRDSYAVVNVAPRFRYKRWHVRGWCALFEWLHARGMRIVVTGGVAAEEREYLHELLAECAAPAIDVGGRLGFGETADLLRGAALYVGPDTATSHLAAACGTPAVVLFGPTDPRLWGPIPRGGLGTPYAEVAAMQRRGNVLLLQEPSLSCVPCQHEGCERHRDSFSACLDALSADSVIEAAQTLLTRSGVSARS